MSRFGSEGSFVCPHVQAAFPIFAYCRSTRHQGISSILNSPTTGPDRSHALVGPFPLFPGSEDVGGDRRSRAKHRISTGTCYRGDNPRCVSCAVRSPLEQVAGILIRVHREIYCRSPALWSPYICTLQRRKFA